MKTNNGREERLKQRERKKAKTDGEDMFFNREEEREREKREKEKESARREKIRKEKERARNENEERERKERERRENEERERKERERRENEEREWEERERRRSEERERKEREQRENEEREREERERRRSEEREREEREQRENEEREREEREQRKNEERERHYTSEDGDEEESLPPQFEGTNQLQICNWLVQHPNILRLANEMLEAQKQKPSSSTSPSSPDNVSDGYRLFDEELKCLFLRSRYPQRLVFEQLVSRIFNLEPYKKEAKNLAKDATKRFADFRNKFNDSILLYTEKLRATDRVNQGNLTNEIINEFISEEVVMKKILKRQLEAVDVNELRKSGALEKLIELTRESFRVHWPGRNVDAIKSLDQITRNLVIPSRSRLNIASSLRFN